MNKFNPEGRMITPDILGQIIPKTELIPPEENVHSQIRAAFQRFIDNPPEGTKMTPLDEKLDYYLTLLEIKKSDASYPDVDEKIKLVENELESEFNLDPLVIQDIKNEHEDLEK